MGPIPVKRRCKIVLRGCRQADFLIPAYPCEGYEAENGRKEQPDSRRQRYSRNCNLDGKVVDGPNRYAPFRHQKVR